MEYLPFISGKIAMIKDSVIVSEYRQNSISANSAVYIVPWYSITRLQTLVREVKGSFNGL